MEKIGNGIGEGDVWDLGGGIFFGDDKIWCLVLGLGGGNGWSGE